MDNGRIFTKFLNFTKKCQQSTEGNIKSSSFQLVNMPNSRDQLELEICTEEIFLPHTKFPNVWIPVKNLPVKIHPTAIHVSAHLSQVTFIYLVLYHRIHIVS